MKQSIEARPILRPMVSFTETFESSQQEKQERFLIDKTIARGIVENNSTIIVEEHQESMGTAVELFNQEEQSNKVLVQYRLRYDKVKTETSALQARINLEKEQHKRLQEEYEKLNNHKRETQRACRDAEHQLDDLNYTLEQTIMSFDCRKAMEDRLKADIIYYKKKIFDGNMELLKKNSDIKLHSTHSIRQKKLSVRCKNLLTSVEKTLSKNQLERSFRIEDVKEALSSKQEHFLRQREREHGLERSMMAALSEKLPEEKELLKLLFTNKLLKKILHFKMESLMKKYSEVSLAFNQIKSNSSVKTVQEFVDKYINKNVIYGQLSESIAKLQPKIQALKEEKKLLQTDNAVLRNKSQELAELFNKQKGVQLEKIMEEVKAVNEKIQIINKYRNTWTNWALSTVAMFRAVPRSEIRSKYEYLGNLLGDTLRMMLKYLSQDEEKQASISEEALGKQLAKGNLKLNDLIVRNVRVKTLGNDQSHREDDDVEYDLVSEKDYLHLARRAVKKQRLARNITLSKA